MKNRKSNEIIEKILYALSTRRRSSLRGIAAEIGISSTWLRKQILIMRKNGLIKSWQLVLNPLSHQQRIFFLLLKTNPNEPLVVNELLNNYNQNLLSTLEGITGDFSLICRFHFPNATEFLNSLDHLYELIGETGFQKYQMIEVIKVHKEQGFPVTTLKRKLKSGELKILLEIQKLGDTYDFPPSTYKIAKNLHVNQPAIYRKLTKWKNENFILGYSVYTPYWQGKYIHAYIQVKAPLGKYKLTIDFCIPDNRVRNIYRTNQEYSLLLRTRHPNLADLNNFLKILYQKAEVEDTLTLIVLDFLRSN
ncbi:MAG: Lrp/AsnC family transcriptional regulator [Candidatus Heimdallarchaeota archaeon]|nr:MAG: Lrp/AsnC family transcriptional regulator [Candidatus Heimdallarchaeota archaeon]